MAKTLLSQGKCVGSKPGQGTRSHMLQLRPGDVCMLLCPTLCDPWTVPPPGSSVHGILQANYAGLGCYTLLQGIFPTQGSNPRLLCLLHGQESSLPLASPGKTQCSEIIVIIHLRRKMLPSQDFPGDPVGKTLCFHCRELRSQMLCIVA